MNTPPALKALNIPRVPSTEANGGLNWSDLYEDPQATVPVQVVLPVDGAINLGDRIDIEWENTTLISKEVDDAAVQTRLVSFLVKVTDITRFGDGLHTLKYKVTTAIGGNESTSPQLEVRVKTSVPGGNDPDPGSPYINENLPVVAGVPDVIDDSTAELTLTVAQYTNMDLDDVVTLDWGGQRLRPSSPLIVGQPVTFVVTRTTLEASPGKVVVRYEVRDLVNNWSRWSLQKETDVEVGNSFLQAPRVSGKGVVDGAVDIDELGGSDLNVDIPTYSRSPHETYYWVTNTSRDYNQPAMELGDTVELTWSGHTAGGTVLPDERVSHTVQQGDIGWGLSLKIPNAKVKLIASGYAVMRYTVTPQAGNVKSSRRASVAVIGAVEALPAPKVVGFEGTLDPGLLPAEGATLRIDASEMIVEGDSLHVTWAGTTASGAPQNYTFDVIVTQNMDGHTIERYIDMMYITPLIDGKVDVSYVLNKGDGPVINSPVTTLQIRSSISELPAPVIELAEGETLDPTQVPANGLPVSISYKPMIASEYVEFHWDGLKPLTNGFRIPATWGDKAIEFIVEKKDVLADLNQNVQTYYTVTLDGKTRTSLSKSLLITAGSESDVTEDFSEQTGDAAVLISEGGSIKTKHMTVRFLQGEGKAGFLSSYILPPEAASYFVNPVLQLAYAAKGDQTIELELDAECQAVSFDVHGVESGSTAVRYLDAAKTELSSQLLPATPNQKISYTSAGKPIRYIELVVRSDWTLWDNFVMRP